MDEQSYNLVVPVKVENRRASVSSGQGIHWREGGSRCTYLTKGNIVETQNSVSYAQPERFFAAKMSKKCGRANPDAGKQKAVTIRPFHLLGEGSRPLSSRR
jgi:hypothetical protein